MVTVSREVLQQQAEEFAAIIDEGFAPASDIVSIQNGQRGASAEAARRWRMTVRGVQYRLESIRRNGFEHIISAAIERYNERKAAEPLREAVRVEMDALEEHRLTREVNRLRAQNKDLLERLANAGDLAARKRQSGRVLLPFGVTNRAERINRAASVDASVVGALPLESGRAGSFSTVGERGYQRNRKIPVLV